MRNVIKVISVIIGTVIGAGFASGQEIYTFFFSYGINGLFGIMLSSFIMGIVIYKTFKIIEYEKVETYDEFLNNLIKNDKMRNFTDILINIFILISFYIMIAGFGAYLEQEYKINGIIGSSILAIICYIVFNTNLKGVIKVNQILIPVIIIVIIIIGIFNIKNLNFKSISNYIIEERNGSWLISSVIYASYNSILLVPILVTMKEYIKKEKNIKYIAWISIFIIMSLLIIIYMFLINVDVDIGKLEMPTIYVVQKISPQIKIIYGVIILISILTTSISLGTSILNNLSKNAKQYRKLNILICVTAIMFSKIGFSKLVNLLYPILGGLGIIQILQILLKNIAKKDKNWYNIGNKR
ncbi:MAG: hypothetical protein V8R82_08575 [Clostridia bacterium]